MANYKDDAILFDGNVDFIINGTEIVKYVGNAIDIIIPFGITQINCNAFSETKIRNILFPKTLRKICMCAFESCEELEKIVFNDGLLEIGEEAFMGCVKMQEIFLPSSLQCIGEHAFYGCSNVEFVDCRNNKYFSIVGGCLISNGCSIIESFGHSLPDNPQITHICSGAFAGYRYPFLKITRNIKYIESFAFEDGKIEVVEIDSDAYIEENAFFRCGKIVEIHISTACKNIQPNAIEVPHNNMLNIYVDSVELIDRIKECISIVEYSPDCTWMEPDLRSGSHFIYNPNQFICFEELRLPNSGFIRHGNICDVYFIGYGYKLDATLKVTLGFVANSKTPIDDYYNNSGRIIRRDVELTNAISGGVDYVCEIMDESFSADKELWMNCPMTFTLNSKELRQALKWTNKITLRFDIVEFEYETEEDYEQNEYIDFRRIDSFIFSVNLQ